MTYVTCLAQKYETLHDRIIWPFNLTTTTVTTAHSSQRKATQFRVCMSTLKYKIKILCIYVKM